ncbi:MAG: VWA domain-containing protein [bacterium]|nr:VWA domain-containing protein [bacterium]
MHWGSPSFLWLLALAPAVALFLRWADGRRRRALGVFADEPLHGALIRGTRRGLRRARAAALVLAVALVAVALAEPKWGYRWRRVARQGIDIVIAIDTSKSMLATDVKPSRIERARMEVRELIDHLRGDRVAIIAFAGGSHVLCPLTLDYRAAELLLRAVRVGGVPLGGTDIAGAVDKAVRMFEGSERKHRALVILSDGEDHGGDLPAAAERAREQGVRIFAVGIGSAGGELIPVEGADGGREFLKDRDGAVVQTRLDERTLQHAALVTGGAYVYPAGGRLGLVDLYRDTISAMEKKELGEAQRKVFENRYQWPLAAALLLLCIEAVLPAARRGARPEARGAA